MQNRLQFFHEHGIARRGRGQDGIVERMIGPDRTGFMLGGKITQEARQEFRRIACIGFHNSYDGCDIDIIVGGMPAMLRNSWHASCVIFLPSMKPVRSGPTMRSTMPS